MQTLRGTVRDSNEVPRVLRVALYGILVTGGALSLPYVGWAAYSPVPVGQLFDLWIIVFIATMVFRGRTYPVLAVALLGAYIAVVLVVALAAGAPLQDTFQAYRWVVYLIAAALAIGRKWGPTRPLAAVTWVMLGMAFIKYGISFIVYGPVARPGLLNENNFEIALFLGLVAVVYNRLGRSRSLLLILAAIVTVLSSSRSGIIAFVALAIYAVFSARTTNAFVKYIMAVTLPLLAIVPTSIFAARAEAGGIDRLNFLEVFQFEVATWTPLNWLFGTLPLTPLSPNSCSRLAFYKALFSSEDDGSCYAVIMHSFVLRVLFDAGILGLIIAFGVTWYAMSRAGVPLALRMCLIAIAAANSFSVSGLNSPYVIAPVLIAILSAGHAQASTGRTTEYLETMHPDKFSPSTQLSGYSRRVPSVRLGRG